MDRYADTRLNVPVFNPGTGIQHQTLERLIDEYQRLERGIQLRYERELDAGDLEAQAAILLHRIEGMHAALEEGGEGDEFNEPFVDIANAAFALAYERAMNDPYQHTELEAFLERGGPEWKQDYAVMDTYGKPAGTRPGYWDYPPLVLELRDIVREAGGDPNEDAISLIEAAKEAFEVRAKHRLRLGRRARLRTDDPIEEARQFIVARGGHLDAVYQSQDTASIGAATTVAGILAAVGLAALAWVVVKRREEAVASNEPSGGDGGFESTDVTATASVPPAPEPEAPTQAGIGSTAPESEPEPETPASSSTPLPETPVPAQPSPAPAPAPPPVPPATPPAPPPARGSSSKAAYLTAPEDIGEPTWNALGTDKEIAVLFPDNNTGGYVHASYRSSLAAAEKYGASLPTHDDMIALADQAKAAGFELDPVILPGASPQLMAAGAKPGDPAMATQLWATISDTLIRAQLITRGWDGKSPVANAGKVWIAGAPPGRAYLMGWRQKNGVWIQSGSTQGQGPHDDNHVDYAQYLTLVRPAQNVA